MSGDSDLIHSQSHSDEDADAVSELLTSPRPIHRSSSSPSLTRQQRQRSSSPSLRQRQQQHAHRLSQHHSRHSHQHHGVIWKRRDVFKNRWRPRWFVWNEHEGVLYYYLLSAPLPPLQSASSFNRNTDDSLISGSNSVSSAATTSAANSSTPRGSVNLRDDCEDVAVHNGYSKDGFYVFYIQKRSGEKLYLAVQSAHTRSVWLDWLREGIQRSTSTSLNRTALQVPRGGLTSGSASVRTAGGVSEWEYSPEILYNEDEVEIPWDTSRLLDGTLRKGLEQLSNADSSWKLMDRSAIPGETRYERREQQQDQSKILLLRATSRISNHTPIQVFGSWWSLLNQGNAAEDSENNPTTSARRWDCHTTVLGERTFHWQVVRNRLGNEYNSDSAVAEVTAIACLSLAQPESPTETSQYTLALLEPESPDACRLTRLVALRLESDTDTAEQQEKEFFDQMIQDEVQLREYLLEEEDGEDDHPSSSMFIAADFLSNASVHEELRRRHEDHEDWLKGQNYQKAVLPALPLWQQAILLLGPIIVHQLMVQVGGRPAALVVFLFLTFLAVRLVFLLRQRGSIVEDDGLIQSVTHRLILDGKGVTRYLTNAEEERLELRQQPGSEPMSKVSIVPIVAVAVSKAFAKEPELHRRRVYQPLLCIDSVVEAPMSIPIDVSVTEDGYAFSVVEGASTRPVQQVANRLSDRVETTNPEHLGPCLIVAPPGCCNSLMECSIDLKEKFLHRNNQVQVIAVIGGMDDTKNYGHKQNVVVTLTVQNSNIEASRRFAQEVQTLLQFPEMCD